MQIRIIQPFVSAHGATPKGAVLTVPDDVGAAYIADGLAVAIAAVPKREVAIPTATRNRSKAVRQSPTNEN